jgi:hypothetical protein
MEGYNMLIKRVSVITGVERQQDIPVDPNDVVLWDLGLGSIEELMPYLSDNDRDFILSGITTTEWQEAFAEFV